ncbi:hypothetical protein BGX26_011087 [Mortierella sp. AD094]|nr:hypothetical protein BGX26_011087 [Mortierella sp. AD094]
MSSDTTPLLGANNTRRTSIPNSRSAGPALSSNLGGNINHTPLNSTPPQRHWSEETEDISGPDPNSFGHQNTGAGYRRRGPPPPVHHSSDLDAQRFSGQDRPTLLRRLLCGCCCLPCRRALFTFQNKYSKTERYSMGIAAFCLLLAIGFLCAYVRAKEAIPESGKNVVVLWIESQFPTTRLRLGTLTYSGSRIRQEVIKAILSPESNNVQKSKDDASKRNLIKLQSLYESCMDEKKMLEVGAKPLADLVQKLIKVFPVTFSVLDMNASLPLLESSIEALKVANSEMIAKLNPQQTRHDGIRKRGDVWQRKSLAKAGREELALAITQLNSVGVASVIDFDVDSDPKNPNETIFKLDESGLGLPSKHYYEEDKIMAVYQKTIEDMFVIVMGKGQDKEVGATRGPKPPVWPEVAKNVVDFEKLLASISTDQEDLDNSELTYNPRTLREIAELIPAIDWSVTLGKLFGSETKTPDPIIVSTPDYLEKLNALLRDTPALTLQNYFAWKLIKSLSADLALDLRRPMLELKAALQGVSADLETPRWETCVDVVDNALGAMAGHYFIEKAFKGDSKEMADDIIHSLRTSFAKGLSHLEWLDKQTLRNATEKVDLLDQKIGYSVESPDVRSSEALEEYFKDLGIDKTDFFGNQIRARTWFTRQVLGELGKPVDKAKWFMSPQTVNAYYNPNVNEIVFPAGILQPPFFHGNNPEYLNYGGIGVVAGHELTHAFDNDGRLFDAHGKLSDWWSNSTLQEFNERSQCFIDQYGNFTVKDPQGRENYVNGKLTLGENLADNGGLKKAFDAWQARYKSDPHGKKYKNHLLAGLEEYSREQLYYMSFARIWCSQRRPASAIEGLRTDPHAPAKWRVNGAVQNSQRFAQVFNCKPRSAMNPDTKCDLW